MIVTRRRRKPFPWKRLILPVVAIALVIFAFAWGPSRTVITAGPMAPVWQSTNQRFNTIAAPFHFAAQNELITQKNQQIDALQQQIATMKAQLDAKTKAVSALNAQVGQLQTQAANAQSSTPAALSSPGPASSTSAFGSGSVSAPASSSATLRRTAEYWANMEPENAAKVVERLPVPYVASVLAQMSPDDVGAILDALPPAVAARLTQENPQLKR